MTRNVSLTPPVDKQPVVEISIDNLNDILYHLENYINLMDFGSDFDSLMILLKKLPLKGMDLSKFPRINRIVR
jgi:hypothetical protein